MNAPDPLARESFAAQLARAREPFPGSRKAYLPGQLHADLDLGALHAKRLTLFGVSNKMRSKAQRAAAVPAFVRDVLPHFASGRIAPQIDQVVDFDQLPQAKARMEAGGHVGKIVLRVNGAD